MAALAVHGGEVTATPVAANKARTYLAILQKLDRTFRTKRLHSIGDDLSVHKAQPEKDWLKRKRKGTIHYGQSTALG